MLGFGMKQEGQVSRRSGKVGKEVSGNCCTITPNYKMVKALENKAFG